MLNEPYESDQTVRWSQLADLVKDVYAKTNEALNKTSFSHKLITLHDPQTNDTIGLRAYCLGPVNNSTESTLLYCDIENGDLIRQTSHDDIAMENSSNDNEEDNLNLPVFKWKELIFVDSTPKDEDSTKKLSIEETLQLERKRMLVTGITSYEFNEKQRRFVFNFDGSLCYFDDNDKAPYKPIKLPSNLKSFKINPSICPSNPDLVAYICEDDVFVLNIRTGVELRLTNNKIDQPNKKTHLRSSVLCGTGRVQ